MKQFAYLFNIIGTWKQIFRNLKRSKELLYQLFYINLTSQFKKTILGSSWLFFDPVISILVWLLLHKAGVFTPGEMNIPYPAYILLSMSIWTFFVGFFNTIGTSVTEAGRMLLEVSFPMEIKIAEKSLINVVNFIIPLLISVVVLIILGVSFTLQSLLFIPALIPLAFLGMSIGIFSSLIEVVFHDLFLLIKRSLRLLMYITPIVYSKNVNSDILQTIMKYNPLNYLISLPRELLTNNEVTNISSYWISCAIALLAFLVVMQIYYHTVNKVIEKILE